MNRVLGCVGIALALSGCCHTHFRAAVYAPGVELNDPNRPAAGVMVRIVGTEIEGQTDLQGVVDLDVDCELKSARVFVSQYSYEPIEEEVQFDAHEIERTYILRPEEVR